MTDPQLVPMVRPRRQAGSAPDAGPVAVPARDAAGAAPDPRVALMVAALGQGVLLHDSVGRITHVDETAARVLGVAAEAVRGRTWHDPSWRTVRRDGRPLAGHEHPVMQVLADGVARHGDVVGLGDEATGVRWLRFDVAVLDGPGGPAVVGALVGDVTAEVQQDYATAVETVRTRRLLSPERDVLLRVSRWGRVLGASPSVEDVLGRSVEDVTGCTVVEFVSPADRPAVRTRLEELAPGDSAVMRVRVRRRGGERRFTRLAMRWVDPDRSEAHVVLADEHDAVVAQARSEDLAERLGTVAGMAGATIGLHGPDGTWTWVSERSAQDLGWEPEDLLGRQLHDLVHPEDADRVDRAHSGAATGDTVTVRFRLCGSDDVHRLVESSLTGRLDPTTGRLAELRSATRPAGELLRREQHLDVAEELLRRCIEQSPVGVVVLAADGSWRKVNDAALRILGQARGSLLRRDHADLVVGEDRDDVLAGVRSVSSGQRDAWHGPASYRGGDDRAVPVRLGVSAVRTAEQELVSLVLHLQPGTEDPEPRHGSALEDTDELTRLCSAELAVDRLVHALERSRRTGRYVGVVWFSLDGLDDVVARHGQSAGDSVLVEVATRLRGSMRVGDTLARVGEDAFLAVCEDAHELEVSRLAARATAGVDVQAPGTPRGRVTASVGAASRPASGTDDPTQVGEELVAAADAAARQVRLRGGAGWQLSKHTFV